MNAKRKGSDGERDAAGRVPVVVFRGNREPWRVVLKLEDFLKLTKEAKQ